MLTLSSEQRRQLRAQAHSLNPVVAIAQAGLSAAVLKEIEVCLKAHALIKVRVYNDDRAVREGYLQSICETLSAAPVQHIGKLLILWRPRPEPKVRAPKPVTKTRRRARQGSVKK
ncbi:MAG: YhbY family RNA-binding protein [Zoogloeaceae bacterium]|jgi:putative YhbY family RNA-binding protein|nr:YhbY family RNA-binding protein [Zoogloeaceae bacterium]